MAADKTLHGAGNLGALLVRAFRWFEEGLATDPDTAHLPRLSGTQFMALASLDGDGTSIAAWSPCAVKKRPRVGSRRYAAVTDRCNSRPLPHWRGGG